MARLQSYFRRLSWRETAVATLFGDFLSFILCRYIIETSSASIAFWSAIALILFCNLLMSWAKAQDESESKSNPESTPKDTPPHA